MAWISFIFQLEVGSHLDYFLTTGHFLVEQDDAEGYANVPSLIEEMVEQA